MSHQIFVLPKAQRQVKALPLPVQQRVNKAVKALRDNPWPPGAKKLKDTQDLYRIRVGDYRVIYGVGGDLLLVLVVTVGHRKDVYEKLLKKYTPDYLRSIIERDPNQPH